MSLRSCWTASRMASGRSWTWNPLSLFSKRQRLWILGSLPWWKWRTTMLGESELGCHKADLYNSPCNEWKLFHILQRVQDGLDWKRTKHKHPVSGARAWTPRAARPWDLGRYFPEQLPIVERSKRTCKAIALLQLFSLRKFNGSRIRSSKSLGQRRAKTAAGALQKATQPTSAVHTWHCLVTRYLSQNSLAFELRRTCKLHNYKLQLAETCAHDAVTCMYSQRVHEQIATNAGVSFS